MLHDPVEDREVVEEDHWYFLSQEKWEFWWSKLYWGSRSLISSEEARSLCMIDCSSYTLCPEKLLILISYLPTTREKLWDLKVPHCGWSSELGELGHLQPDLAALFPERQVKHQETPPSFSSFLHLCQELYSQQNTSALAPHPSSPNCSQLSYRVGQQSFLFFMELKPRPVSSFWNSSSPPRVLLQCLQGKREERN